MHELKEARWIWQDGTLVPWAEATTHVMSHSLHYGVSFFEGIRTYRRQDGAVDIFRLRDHIERLFDSAKLFRVEVPFAPSALEAACVQVVEKNALANGYIRPVIYLGPESMGVAAPGASVHVAIATFNWGDCLATVPLRRALRCKSSTFLRPSTGGTFFRAKVAGHYTNAYLAKHEAARLGYDEALLFDQKGCLTEANSENAFIVSKGRLLTPPEWMAILPGLTREFVLRLAQDLGYETQETPITRDALMLAEEVFLTGTYAEISPVVEIDDAQIADGQPGPMTQALSAAFAEVLGLGSEHPHYGALFSNTRLS